jgi:hypothetical protein
MTAAGAVLEVGGLTAICPNSGLGQLKPQPGETVSALVLYLDYQVSGLLQRVSSDTSPKSLSHPSSSTWLTR